jgi:RHS repeat-associated protein
VSRLLPALCLVALLSGLAVGQAPPQPDETLPGFKPNSVFDSGSIDNVNLFSGDPGIVIPLGPVYQISPGLTWQLRATYSSKFWTLDRDDGNINPDSSTGLAYLNGFPGVGVGWSLHLGYIGPKNAEDDAATGPCYYHSPVSGRHRFGPDPNGSGALVSRDSSRLRFRSVAGGYEIDFSDGTTHVFTQAFKRPRPNPVNPGPGYFDWRDFSDEPFFTDLSVTNYYGLTAIRDRFARVVLSVSYAATTGVDAWKIQKVCLGAVCSGSPQVNFTWQDLHFNYTGTGTNLDVSWPVVTSVSLPVTGGDTLTADFTVDARTFPRNVYDQPSGWTPAQNTWDLPAPFLSVLQLRSADGVLARYSFEYRTTASGAVRTDVDTGALSAVNLPTGGRVEYTYASTSGGGGDSYDLEASACGDGMGPLAPQPAIPDPLQRQPGLWMLSLADHSPAVTVRLEKGNGVAGTPSQSQTTYCRAQRTRYDEGLKHSVAVGRQTVVRRSDGNGARLATKHIFNLAYNGPDDAGGLEFERLLYSTDAATGLQLRSVVSCFESDTDQWGQTYPSRCGYFRLGNPDTTGERTFYRLTSFARLQKEMTIYGVNPADIGDCSAATGVACRQVAHSSWNAPAAEYGTVSESAGPASGPSVALVPPNFVSRNTTTAWWSNQTAWILKLYTQRTAEDVFNVACPSPPCIRTSTFTFDGNTGNLSSTTTDDLKTDYTYDVGHINPIIAISAGQSSLVIGSVRTDRAFKPNGLLLTSQKLGLSWNSFDVDRDPNTGLITASRDPNGLVTSYSWDALGRLKSVTPPQGESPQTVCYVPFSATPTGAYLLVKKGIPAGRTACTADDGVPGDGTGPFEGYLYDGFGRLFREAHRLPNAQAGGSYFAFREKQSNDAGYLASESVFMPCGSAPGATTVSSCFSTAYSPPPGSKTTYQNFDLLGRARLVTAPDGKTTTRSFDDGTAVPNSDFTEFVTQRVGSQDVTRGSRKDMFGRTLIVTDGTPGSTFNWGTTPYHGYVYNVFDKLTSVLVNMSPGPSQARTFTYDATGFLLSETHPEKGTTTYVQYDAAGNVLQKSEGSLSLTYTYDPASRLKTADAGSARYITNCYDGTACADLDGLGNFAGGTYPKGRLTRSFSYNWDVDNTAIRRTIRQDFGYSELGGRLSDRVTVITGLTLSPPAASEHWHYDAPGRVAAYYHPQFDSSLFVQNTIYQSGYPVRVYGNGIPMVPAATYNPAGGLASYTTGDGTAAGFTTTIQQDATGLPRPARIFTGATIDGFSLDTGTYAYDGVGNITSIGADAFAYDTESRLTSSSLSGYAAQAFRYDVYGNLLQKGNGCFDPDPATNRIRQSGTASGSACNLTSATFTYDARGQLTYGQAQTIDGTSVADSYGWDPMGRVARAQRGVLWKNVYDASGERLVHFPPYPDLQTANNNTYTFRDDGNRLSAEYLHTTGAGGESLTLSKSNLYLGNLLVAAYVPTEGGDATWQFYASDHLGSPRLAITHAGYKLKRHRYAAFGDELVVAGETDTLTQRVRFATMERDFDAERYYDHARHQDYNLGRFLSPDLLSGKIQDPQSWNRYTYARNNPAKFVDPDGRNPAIGWVVRLSKTSETKLRALFTKGQVVAARLESKDVLLKKASLKELRQLEKKAAPGAARKTVRIDEPHSLGDGKTGYWHAQTEGKAGHLFTETLLAVSLFVDPFSEADAAGPEEEEDFVAQFIEAGDPRLSTLDRSIWNRQAPNNGDSPQLGAFLPSDFAADFHESVDVKSCYGQGCTPK